VGNIFTADGSPVDLDLTNGGTDVFFDVLTLAGCALAETPWQQNLVLRFADGHRAGRGTDGFDLREVPWTEDWRAERAFFLRVVDTAARRYGWDRLRYDPPFASAYMAEYHGMLDGYRPRPVEAPEWGDWRTPPTPELLARCPKHDLYEGEYGCRLCGARIQPIE
jgi:hypothetical protein